MTVTPFPMVELAAKDLLEAKVDDATGKVGGDLSYDGVADFYIWFGLVPGGRTDEIYGEWILDIDVFSKSYATSMNKCLEIESKLIGSRHATDTLRIDTVTQNEAPFERPWDDDTVYRVGATYVFTARRSG